MAGSSIIHARIDGPTKEATERVLRSLGLTPTEAIRLLYRQIALRGEFPLELRVPNELTAASRLRRNGQAAPRQGIGFTWAAREQRQRWQRS